MVEAWFRHRQDRFSMDVQFSLTSRWTVLFGSSGAGKSTLLRLLAGLVTPDEGYITIEQRPVLDTARRLSVPPGQRSIGFVTQRPALFPHLSVLRNVEFGISGLHRSSRQKRASEMLRLFGAEELASREIADLSGGERQRVALAQALAPRPRLLLLDEPLAPLDAASAQDILTRLLAIDVQVLYVSHNLAEIWRIPADVVLLENGRITGLGLLQHVLAQRRSDLLQQLAI